MDVDRRRFLKSSLGAITTAGMLGIAGCSSSCPDSDRPAPARSVSFAETPTGPFDEEPAGTWIGPRGTNGNTGYVDRRLPTSDLTLRWRTELDLPPTDSGSLSTSPPSVRSGIATVADARRVHALSTRTGHVRWRSDPMSVTTYDALWEFEANTVSPLVGPDETVYVGTETGVVALDGTDGSIEWTAEGTTATSSPRLLDETVYALGSESLVSLDRDGTERWRRAIDRGENPVPPAVGSNSVVVTGGEGVVAFDADSGDDRWSRSIRVETYPVLEGNLCVVGNDEGLHALSIETGETLWTFSRGDYRALLSPVLTPESIYAVEQPGEAGAASFALDRTDGPPTPRWCSYIGSGAMTGATNGMAIGVLSIGEGPESVKGVVGFTADRGETAWAVEGGSRPRSWVTPPAVLDGALIVSTRGGTVFAVGRGD
ncbi:MAG: PQQ-binding-like beta-propeller repeat protein [Halodesulfurarchaeum sp.]